MSKQKTKQHGHYHDVIEKLLENKVGIFRLPGRWASSNVADIESGHDVIVLKTDSGIFAISKKFLNDVPKIETMGGQ